MEIIALLFFLFIVALILCCWGLSWLGEYYGTNGYHNRLEKLKSTCTDYAKYFVYNAQPKDIHYIKALSSSAQDKLVTLIAGNQIDAKFYNINKLKDTYSTQELKIGIANFRKNVKKYNQLKDAYLKEISPDKKLYKLALIENHLKLIEEIPLPVVPYVFSSTDYTPLSEEKKPVIDEYYNPNTGQFNVYKDNIYVGSRTPLGERHNPYGHRHYGDW